MTSDEVSELRGLDEEERLAWQEYAETKSFEALQRVAHITERKAIVYGSEVPERDSKL